MLFRGNCIWQPHKFICQIPALSRQQHILLHVIQHDQILHAFKLHFYDHKLFCKNGCLLSGRPQNVQMAINLFFLAQLLASSVNMHHSLTSQSSVTVSLAQLVHTTDARVNNTDSILPLCIKMLVGPYYAMTHGIFVIFSQIIAIRNLACIC